MLVDSLKNWKTVLMPEPYCHAVNIERKVVCGREREREREREKERERERKINRKRER